MVAFLGLGLLLALSSGASAAPAKADREAMKKALSEVIANTALKSARVSMQVVSLEDGAVVYALNPNDLLNPASNVKLFTAAAALVKLGPDYRFETEFLADHDLVGGKARHLFVRGRGDPSITTERLFNMVAELYHTGLREVLGDIVIDESFFDSERLAPGFDQEKSDRAYMAPTGAVSLNWNAVGIYLRPADRARARAAVELEPPSDYFLVESNLSTGSRSQRRFSVSLETSGEKQKVVVRGIVPGDREPLTVWKKIDNPPLYFAHTLKRMLTERGIKVRGRVRVGTVSTHAMALYVAQSESLDLILKKLNKVSSNFIAEQLIKTLGAEARGVPGTFANGIDVVEEFLEKEVGIQRGSYVMRNGSGLNDTNRFSAVQINRLLRFMYEKFPLAPEFLSSLGIAGKDGTLRYRFEGSDAVGRLRGKTGTLENVSALSGYVQSMGGERFAFAMLANDCIGRSAPIVQGLDALGVAVAAGGTLQGPSRAAAAMITQESVQGPLDEATSRIRTYLSLGKQADRRNAPFLRTAWRTEKDPAVRAVVAESLYQSNPEDYVAARTLLDSFAANEAVYGRLRKIALLLNIEVPGVPSVVELAAQGNIEALSRLIELGSAAAGDEAAQKDLSDGLAEVSRTAPDELLAALRSAESAERDTATTLLAKGLTKAADPEHPFWPALRKMNGSVDERAAAFAKELEVAMSRKMAAEKVPVIQPAAANEAESPEPQPSPRPAIRPGG